MYFLLKSEMEAKGNNFCPYCEKIQIKKVNKTDLYNKYTCWNKDCDRRNVPFIILNAYIEGEEYFTPICEECQKPFEREVQIDKNKSGCLVFRCSSKLCEAQSDPFIYNLRSNEWKGRAPKLKIYEDQVPHSELKVENKKLEAKEVKNKTEEEVKTTKLGKIKQKKAEIFEIPHDLRKINKTIPLLTMDCEQYSAYLKEHNRKIVVLVDLPNLVRTMRQIYRSKFEAVLQKAHALLIKSINNLFNSDRYIIRYFSKPDEDLEVSNKLLYKFCKENPHKEFFHLLQLTKGGGYSDIDNYLIANGVEILERCNPIGFVIISSDKDYLPVMRIAQYKNVKSYMMGLNTPQIYGDYDVKDIQFLGIMKYFKK